MSHEDGDRSLEDILNQLGGGAVAQGTEEIWGSIKGHGSDGLRILFVDDRAETIEQFVDLERQYSDEAAPLPCQMVFFRIGDAEGAKAEDFIAWLDGQAPFDVIYLDGDLGSQGSGTELAKRIRNLRGRRYQPIALFTAQASFLTTHRKSAETDGLRVIAKFSATGKEAIQSMVIDAEDVIAQARERFWHDARMQVAKLLDEGKPVKEVAESFGAFLAEHHGVTGWYLREWKPKGLIAIAKLDVFQAGDCMALPDTPAFERDLLHLEHPWSLIEALDSRQAGVRPIMEGWRVIAARLGGRVAGGATALLTAYRPLDAVPFTEADAIGLHHVAVLLRLALARDQTSERLRELSLAIGKVLNEKTTDKICSIVSDFLQEQINAPVEQQGIQTKTSVRLFRRGNGELHRYGEVERKFKGSLEEKSAVGIPFSVDCVYTRVVRYGKSLSSNTAEEKGRYFFATTDAKIKSYLTVPIEHNGAIIGAINLEAADADVYDDKRDEPLVKAVAGVAAAAIFDVRARRFMEELSQLAYQAITLPTDPQRKIESFLDEAAAVLYRLTGYSEMLIFTGSPDLKEPWTLAHGWQGAGIDPTIIDAQRLQTAARNVAARWETTYLKKALSEDSENAGIYHGNANDRISDMGKGGLRTEGRETQRTTAMLLGEKGAHQRAIVLTFEHPRPLPTQFDPILNDFAKLVDKVYDATLKGEDFRTFLQRQEIEAQQVQVFSTMRHTIGSQLSSIANTLDKPRSLGWEPTRAIEEAKERLKAAEEEFDKSRVIMRLPQPEPCDLRQIWRELVAEHATGRRPDGVDVDAGEGPIPVETDPVIARFILFHLLDNALEHGVQNGATHIFLKGGNAGGAVCDNGRPLSAEGEAHLFELGSSRRALGGGHGLYMAKAQAKRLGGDLRFSRDTNFNRFTLTLGGN